MVTRLREWIWSLAGAHVPILRDCPSDRMKFAQLGLAILLTGIFATLSSGYAMYSAINAHWVIVLVASFLWGMLIVNIDSLLVSTMDNNARWHRIFWPALVRLTLAVFIGVVIARPLELKLFETEIRQERIQMEIERCSAQNQQWISQINASLTNVSNEIDTIQKRYTDYELKIQQLEEVRNFEEDGIDTILYRIKTSGKRRKGERYDTLTMRKSKLSIEKDSLSVILSQFRRDRRNLENEKNGLNKKCEPNNVRKYIDSTKTFLASNIALHRIMWGSPANMPDTLGMVNSPFVSTSHGGGSRPAFYVVFFVTLLFVFIEIVPILVKLLQPAGEYERRWERYKKDYQRKSTIDLKLKYPAYFDLNSEGRYAQQLSKNYKTFLDNQRDIRKKKQQFEREETITVQSKISTKETVLRGTKAEEESVENLVNTLDVLPKSEFTPPVISKESVHMERDENRLIIVDPVSGETVGI